MNELKSGTIQDQVLVERVKPPAELAQSFLTKDGRALALFLDVLFSAHEIHHLGPDRNDNNVDVWTDISDTAPFRKMYERCNVPPCLENLAPNWDAYVSLAERWFHEFPHYCDEYDDWFWGHDEPGEHRSLDYFRKMLIARLPAKKSSSDPGGFVIS